MYKSINSLGPPTGENGTELSKRKGGGKISNIFLRCLEFLIFFGVMVDARPEPTYEEKMRVPPLVHPKKKYQEFQAPQKYLKF